MTVPISTLGESLPAVCAGEWARTHMRAHVVHDVAKLREAFEADGALQLLVESSSLSI